MLAHGMTRSFGVESLHVERTKLQSRPAKLPSGFRLSDLLVGSVSDHAAHCRLIPQASFGAAAHRSSSDDDERQVVGDLVQVGQNRARVRATHPSA